jgi:hypothetical protein
MRVVLSIDWEGEELPVVGERVPWEKVRRWGWVRG